MSGRPEDPLWSSSKWVAVAPGMLRERKRDIELPLAPATGKVSGGGSNDAVCRSVNVAEISSFD